MVGFMKWINGFPFAHCALRLDLSLEARRTHNGPLYLVSPRFPCRCHLRVALPAIVPWLLTYPLLLVRDNIAENVTKETWDKIQALREDNLEILSNQAHNDGKHTALSDFTSKVRLRL